MNLFILSKKDVRRFRRAIKNPPKPTKLLVAIFNRIKSQFNSGNKE